MNKSPLLAAMACFISLVFGANPHAADDCGEGTQQEMNACVYRSYQQADRELNKVYKEKMGSLSANDQAQLRKEQRAWLKRLEPDCQALVKEVQPGGTGWQEFFYGCLADKTQTRVKFLRQWKARQ